MPATLDLAAPRLGSGARFKKLSATLASRGAHDPDALAAYIGRRKYGAKGMGRLSHGKNLANPGLGIYLAGGTLKCPQCGHAGPAADFGDTDDDSDSGPPAGKSTTVKGTATSDHARTGPAVELAGAPPLTRHPIRGPMDVLVKRGDNGRAQLKHRHGGAVIAELRRDDNGKWVASVNGRDLTPRDHQRTALMEAVGTWNTAIRGGRAQDAAPLRPEPVQTPLMAEYGIPAMRSAGFATPVTGASDGPKATTSSDSSTDGNGLSPKAQAVYKKLLAKGFPQARALAFAKNSERFAKKADG